MARGQYADVVVIGAGVAGLCVARLLAEAGTSVLVLEAGQIGGGASGQCAGQALMGVVEHPGRVVRALGLDDARPLYELSVRSVEMLRDWGLLAHHGGRWVALDEREPADIEESHRALDALGIASEVVAEGTLGTPELHVPAEGAVVPARALAALLAGARAAGAEVREGARVLTVSEQGGALHVHTVEGPVAAELVVYAAGAAVLGIDGFFDDKVVPVREQALLVPGRVEGGRAGHGYTWWSSWAPGALVVGGCRWATPHLETGETEPVVVASVQERIEAFAARLVGPVEVERRWAWIEAHTCDGLPIVGPLPGSARHIACVGFVGNDWGLAPGAAALVAEGLVGSGVARVVPRFAPTRF